MARSLLDRMLDDNARFDLANRGTVNHLPMALIALSRLGADDIRLGEYFRWWEENKALPRRDSRRRIGRNEWRACLGDAAMFDALSAMFSEWVAECGATEVVGEVFPVLSRGIAAAAFHGLIRLAYGLDAGHAGEIGAGLAALTSRYVELPLDWALAPTAASVRAALSRLSDALGDVRFEGAGIIGRMQAACADRRFAAALALPPFGAEVLSDLAGAAIELYWTTGDFTVLHMVTATHAARLVFERFPALVTQDAVRSLWGAACAAYASVGAPRPGDPAAPSDVPPWDRIAAQAIASNDDHVIKMTYTCRVEGAYYGNPLYQAAAARLAAAGRA